MDDWDYCIELQLSERGLSLANRIWGDVSSTEFAQAITRSHAAIYECAIASEGSALQLYIAALGGIDQEGISWVQKKITQFIPSILCTGLADSLHTLAEQEAGTLFVDEKSFLESDIDFVIEHGVRSLLERFRSMAPNDENADPWILSIRSRKVANLETLTSLGITLPKEFQSQKQVLQRLASFAKTEIVGSASLRSECKKLISQVESESKEFIRREFISWEWIQAWVSGRVPKSVVPHRQSLLLLLNLHFKKRTVSSEELTEIGNAVESCSAYVTEIISIWQSSESFNLEMLRNLCDMVLANAPEMSPEQWADCVIFFEDWRSQNQDESLHTVIEKIRKKVQAVMRRNKAESKARRKRRTPSGIAASHRGRCESCGRLVEKSEHCECNWN
tara:strand:- start:52977 stop:54149 length:1173 start_codon:yes stop_codon:yes gene_type:complete